MNWGIPRDNRRKWLLTILSGLTLFLVLYVYEGFHIEEGESLSGHSLWQRAVLFALATSITFYVFEFLLSRAVRTHNLMRLLLFHFLEVLSAAGVTFLLFNYFWNWTEWNWSAWILLLGEYATVMIIPFSVTFAFPGNGSPKKEALLFKSSNGKQHLRLEPENLLFLKSADNYVEVLFISGNKTRKELIRNTLHDLLQQNAHIAFLQRCHRSYAVNVRNIDSVRKRNQVVYLEIQGESIPVSNKYQSKFELAGQD